MATINRSIFLDQPEPSPLSMRVPKGQETRLSLRYFDRSGHLISSDLAAQLQLMGRSGGALQTYDLPATDVVNGLAGTLIPEGDLTDPNGYRLAIQGTRDGQPSLFASGTVHVSESLGPRVALPVDVIDRVDLTFERGDDVELDVSMWVDTAKANEYELAGTTIVANILDASGGTVLVPFTVTVADANTVKLSLTEEQVDALPATCWWALLAGTGSGVTTLCEGEIIVTGAVTALTEVVADYDYQKPDLADPTAGQIVHGNFVRNLLKVSALDAAANDMSATFVLVEPGDQILLGASTWMVDSTHQPNSNWFEFMVTPVAQDAASGVVPVTFRRP
jgi:hypothetical protein